VHSGKNLILYLGRKGGGYHMFGELQTLNCLNGSLNIGPRIDADSSCTFSTNWHKNPLTIPLVSLYATLIIVRRRKDFARLVIPMSSWADLLPSAVSLLMRKEVSRVIHDISIHPGDPVHQVVPLKIQILLSTNLMTLSNFVSEKLSLMTTKSVKILGMYFPKKHLSSTQRVNLQIIFFGRLSEYKGAKLLFETLEGVSKKMKIVIAGQGDVPENLALRADVFVNRFLTDQELANVLSESDIAIFPYIEGSQSGAMALAATYGCKIVGTNVGGIAEFGSKLQGFWFSNPDSISLRIALDAAIRSNQRPQISNEMRYQFFKNMGILT